MKAGYRSLGSVFLCESSASLVWCWFPIEGVTAAVEPANDHPAPWCNKNVFLLLVTFGIDVEQGPT